MVSLRELERLYEEEFPRFFRLALSMLGNREAARDAVQEAFARAVRDRRKLRHAAGLDLWIWRTLTNVCRDELRDRRNLLPGDVPPEVAHDADPGDAELRRAVASLPERQRLAVFLRHHGDLDYPHIAAVMGISEGTVAATLHSAHARLREVLREVAR